MSRDYGRCKLCLKEGKLQKSHLIPRAYYKLLRTPGADEPNPITADEEVTRTSQEQMAQHLLCAACEDLFNKNGERWVLLNNYRLDGPSPLYRVLQAAKADPQFASGTVYSSLSIPEIDIDKLVWSGNWISLNSRWFVTAGRRLAIMNWRSAESPGSVPLRVDRGRRVSRGKEL